MVTERTTRVVTNTMPLHHVLLRALPYYLYRESYENIVCSHVRYPSGVTWEQPTRLMRSED